MDGSCREWHWSAPTLAAVLVLGIQTDVIGVQWLRSALTLAGDAPDAGTP